MDRSPRWSVQPPLKQTVRATAAETVYVDVAMSGKRKHSVWWRLIEIAVSKNSNFWGFSHRHANLQTQQRPTNRQQKLKSIEQIQVFNRKLALHTSSIHAEWIPRS
jgi:hypothetical protein